MVAYDPDRGGEALRARRDDVVWVPGPPSPPHLAAAAVRAARGAVVLLTEDHCVPSPEWVRRLHAATQPGEGAPPVGAAGGPVELSPHCRSSLEWAFHFSDFAPYVPPVEGGPARSLSVCNAAYPRTTLERLDAARIDAFHETRVHAVIRRRVGPLLLVADASVVSGRRVRFVDALRERRAFGRLYGAVHVSGAGAVRRGVRALATPLLPPLLLARVARRAWRSPAARGRLLGGLPSLIPLVLAWSWGEGLGVLTGRGPAALTTAPEPPRRGDGRGDRP